MGVLPPLPPTPNDSNSRSLLPNRTPNYTSKLLDAHVLSAKDAALVQEAQRHRHPELAIPWFKLLGGPRYFSVGSGSDFEGGTEAPPFDAVHVVTSR